VFPEVGSFTRRHGPNAHIKVFRAQMLICGGSGAVRCKMLAGTLVGTTLDWFSNLLGGSLTSLEVFTKLFVAHIATNKAKPPKTTNLF